MSKIRIKNFGPIKEGYLENDGWMDIKKVTVFIGNQGSGKSTVAKLISTLTWMEKAMNRGDVKEPKSIADFWGFFKYQNLDNYFKPGPNSKNFDVGPKTSIEYIGDVYDIHFCYDNVPRKIVTKKESTSYITPKIMYVPAERNFLSVVKNAYSERGLPEPLFEFALELRKSQEHVGSGGLKLPINNVYYKYDARSENSFIYNEEYDINIREASSGFQSFVPLYLVSKNLSDLLSKDDKDLNSNTVSVSQKMRFNNEITEISLSTNLSNEQKELEYARILSKFINKAFINIVEEPEQNLFPSSQQKMLNSLLAFNNTNEWNKLIMTTHSPYLLVFLTLCVEANRIKDKAKQNKDLKSKLNEIVPINSIIDGNDLVVYQLDEKSGIITKLKSFEGLPSDDNELNNSLAEANVDFSKLLDLEDLCQ